MGLTRLAIKIATKLPKIENGNTFLFIGPHPDDIEIGCGATIAKLIQAKKNVIFLICTDGRFGNVNVKDKHYTPDDIARIRKEEVIKACNILGVKTYEFLNLSDGGMYSQDELLHGIGKVMNKYNPDFIFATDPDVDNECHADHLNVGRAAKELANFANYPVIFSKYLDGEEVNSLTLKGLAFYMTAKPNQFVKTSKKFIALQFKALEEGHQSQYPQGCNDLASVKLYLKIRSIDFGLRSFKGRAEGFRVLGSTQMHCLPEVSK